MVGGCIDRWLRVQVRVLGLSAWLGLKALHEHQVSVAYEAVEILLLAEACILAGVGVWGHGVQSEEHLQQSMEAEAALDANVSNNPLEGKESRYNYGRAAEMSLRSLTKSFHLLLHLVVLAAVGSLMKGVGCKSRVARARQVQRTFSSCACPLRRVYMQVTRKSIGLRANCCHKCFEVSHTSHAA